MNTEMLDSPLDQVLFCGLDVETTQVPRKRGALAVIEIAVQQFQGTGPVGQTMQTLVNPECHIRPFDTSVSGISDQMVADAPRFRDIWDRFRSYIGGSVVVAHNAVFDQRALDSQCSRDGLCRLDRIFVDTAALARHLVQIPQYSLDVVCARFGVSTQDRHRAAGDCEAVGELLRAMLPAIRDSLGVRRLRQLCQLLKLRVSPPVVQRSLFD